MRDHLSPSALAAELGISRRIVLDAIARHELRALRAGHRTIVISRRDADRWIAARTTGPEAATT